MPKKYLNDAGTESIIQETRRRIAEAGGGGAAIGATVNISASDSDLYNKDCVITSSVLIQPITVTLDDTGSATLKINATGTYTFTVTISGTTYSAEQLINSNMTYNVTLAKYKITTFADGTDEELVAQIEALDNGVLTVEELGWEVGDERTIHLTAISAGNYNAAHAAQDQTLVIVDISDYNGVGHFIIGFKDCLNEGENMEDTSTNENGWHNSRGRKCCDAIFDGMIPSTLKPIFKTFTVYSSTIGGQSGTGITAQSCKLSLFACKETLGEKGDSSNAEFQSELVHGQMEHYKTAANRVKKMNGSNTYWWERTPSFQNSNRFGEISVAGYEYAKDDPTTYVGFSPFGVI